MPTWGEQLGELQDLKQAAAAQPPRLGNPSPHDQLRRKYLKALAEHTGRGVIYYGTCWLENKSVPHEDALSLTLGDKQGFMEAVSNITGTELDLILTSPGGSPEAAEANMGYLRTRFKHILLAVQITRPARHGGGCDRARSQGDTSRR